MVGAARVRQFADLPGEYQAALLEDSWINQSQVQKGLGGWKTLVCWGHANASTGLQTPPSSPLQLPSADVLPLKRLGVKRSYHDEYAHIDTLQAASTDQLSTKTIRQSLLARGLTSAQAKTMGGTGKRRAKRDQRFASVLTPLVQYMVKPEETLVEARSDSDVQIDRQIWV
ncbi:hypothetical protein EV422DRAFT_508476 [Fimicolochytrium jonesii]|nr:hypothetical protein EV422DRAFT_508476 [Fimicolochytrium jonesii]